MSLDLLSRVTVSVWNRSSRSGASCFSNVVTADYSGAVSRIALNKVRYVAIFEGTPLVPVEPDPTPEPSEEVRGAAVVGGDHVALDVGAGGAAGVGGDGGVAVGHGVAVLVGGVVGLPGGQPMKKLKTLISTMLCLCAVCALCAAPASALEYNINAPRDPEYGKPTSFEPVVTADGGAMKNEDVSKSAALIPPVVASDAAVSVPDAGALKVARALEQRGGAGSLEHLAVLGRPPAICSTPART